MFLVNGRPWPIRPRWATRSPVATRSCPWPKSYVDYVASLPGVTVVEAPRPVTIGGVKGRQIVVKTPPMHPTMFLKGDTCGSAAARAGSTSRHSEVIELTVDGKRLLIDYGDGSEQFAARRPVVDAVFQSIRFDPAG